LRNLTAIDDTIKAVKKLTGEEIILHKIPLDDPEVYAMLQQGRTTGVFQLEGSGITALVQRLQPTEFRDLIAILARAEELFADIEKFARYGFVKAHSTAYALISYWTAYLKVKYPTCYLAALLTSVSGNTEKIAEYIQECRELGITVLPPDINESEADFTPLPNKQIRFGLGAIKNVGSTTVQAILAARQRGGPFRNFADFCRRVASDALNREVLESLIKCGAFDRFGTRKGLLSPD
jgi:DNA polymerase III alpha subunit